MNKQLKDICGFLFMFVWGFAVVKLIVFLVTTSIMTWQILAMLSPELKPEIQVALQQNVVFFGIVMLGSVALICRWALGRSKERRRERGLDFKHVSVTKKRVKVEFRTKKGAKFSVPATRITRRKK